MEKLGKVRKIENGIAEIEIERDSACGENCAACGLCGGKQLVVSLPVDSTISAGDTVKLAIKDSKILWLSAVGYLSLTILILAGAALGTHFGREWLGFLLAFILLVCGVLILRKAAPKPGHIHVEKI